MSLVTMTKTGIPGTSEVSEDAFTQVWQPQGWVLASGSLPAIAPYLHWRDAWSSSTTYYISDVVSYSGTLYVSLKTNINVTPGTDSTTWKVFMAAGGAPPSNMATTDTAQTFTAEKRVPVIRVKSLPWIDPTHPDFGAACDGTTNDDVAWAAVNTYIGDTSQFRDARIFLPGPSAVSQTVLFQKKRLTIEGKGWAGQRTSGAGLDAGFVWIGSNNDPVLQLEQAFGCVLRGFRVLGHYDPTRRPDVGVRFFVPSSYQIPNSRNEIDHIYFGPVFGFDGASANPWFNKAIAFEGANLQNDQTLIRNVTVRLANYGYYAPNSQSVLNSLDNVRFDFCGTPIYTRAHLDGRNVLCSVSSVTDLDIASCRVSMTDFNSESMAKLAKLRGYAELTMQGRYCQLSNSLAGSGSAGTVPVIDAVDIYRQVVTLRDFEFQDAGYTNAGTPKISIKPDAASFAKKVLVLENVTWRGDGIDGSNIDTAIGFGGGADECFIWGHSMKPTGIGQERFFFNHLTVNNPTPNFNRNGMLRTGMMPMFTKAGAPVDGDFPFTPQDGSQALDTTNHRLYVRDGGTWRYAALT